MKIKEEYEKLNKENSDILEGMKILSVNKVSKNIYKINSP